MKKQTFISICIILMSTLLMPVKSLATYQEFKPDTIIINLPNQVIIEIASKNCRKYLIDSTYFTSTINRFLKYCQTINVEEILNNGPHRFSIKQLNGILPTNDSNGYPQKAYNFSISERAVSNKIAFSNDLKLVSINTHQHVAEFERWNEFYRIYFDNLSQLQAISQMDMPEIFEHVKNNLKQNPSSSNRKDAFLYHYQVTANNKVERIYEEFDRHPDEMLLHAGTGLENIRNAWVGSFSIGMGFSFSKKLVKKNTYGINYEWLYDFSTPEEKNINHFLSFSYARNLSNNPENYRWLGVSLGYLVHREGNLFEDHTFRLGISREIHKYIKVEPQIYFHDFFKDAYPGIKIGVSF